MVQVPFFIFERGKCKLHLAVTQVAKLSVHVCFSHKKRFIDLAHQLIRFTVLCCEEHYSPEVEKLYEQNEMASCK